MTNAFNKPPQAMRMPERDEREDARVLTAGLASRPDGLKIHDIDAQRGELIFHKPIGSSVAVERRKFEDIVVERSERSGGAREKGWSLLHFDTQTNEVVLTKRDNERGGALTKKVPLKMLLSWQP